jgi:hypothetical protein
MMSYALREAAIAGRESELLHFAVIIKSRGSSIAVQQFVPQLAAEAQDRSGLLLINEDGPLPTHEPGGGDLD